MATKSVPQNYGNLTMNDLLCSLLNALRYLRQSFSALFGVTFCRGGRLECDRVKQKTNSIRLNMKKILVAVMGLICASALVVNAQDAKPAKKMTPEQEALNKEMLAKYDENKDGKLDKTERARISKEDKEKMVKAGLLKAPRKAADAPATSAAPGAAN
jgi:hypothetical protein